MRINKNENNDFYDCDGTLILHLSAEQLKNHPKIDILDPVTKKYITVGVNQPMVRLLRESHQRGFCVKVWSRGGWEWASNVLKALELVPYVDEVLSKPMAYFDDMPIETWLPYRVFLPPNTVYKGN